MTGLASPAGTLYHPTLGLVRYSLRWTSDNPDEQVRDTISLMRDYSAADSRSAPLAADVEMARQSACDVADTWNYINRAAGARRMQFVRDEFTSAPAEQLGAWRPCIETLIRPIDQALLAQPQGDCDDFAMYGAAHLLARGVPCSFATVAADGRDPSVYSHVYLVAYPRRGPYAGQRVPMDLSHGPYLGWEVPNQFGKFCEWPLTPCLLQLGLVVALGILLCRSLRAR